MVRVLITLEPRMYRQAIALALRRGRPDSEVLLAAEESLNGQVHDFAPTCSCAATPAPRSQRDSWLAWCAAWRCSTRTTCPRGSASRAEDPTR